MPVDLVPVRRLRWPLALAAAMVLAGCAGAPRVGVRGADGPGANPPPNLAATPDAEPRIEPTRSGGPNKPYEVFGRGYVPLTGDPAFSERGLASWYGRKFHGRPTSSGEPYDMYAMTAAHRTMPIPSYARVRNPANGREVIVRINDRGPFHAGRVIDLSYTAALRLGVLNAVAPVEVERITQEAIRTGAWRGGGEPRVLADTTTPTLSPPPSRSTATVAAPSTSTDAVAGPPASPGAGAGPRATAAADAIDDAAPATSADAVHAATAGAAAAEATSRPSPRPITAAPPGFWMQLGAFRERDGALDFQRKVERELDWLAPLLAVFVDRDLHRLQAGPYPSRGDASIAAERLRASLQLVPMIVERR